MMEGDTQPVNDLGMVALAAVLIVLVMLGAITALDMIERALGIVP